MGTKNKFAFAFLVLGLLLFAIAVIGATRLGFDSRISNVLTVAALALINVAVIVYVGIFRLLKLYYILVVIFFVLCCVYDMILSDNILDWILLSALSVIMVASLVPIVFRDWRR